MSTNALRIGVAGLGRIGKIHFDNLRNHVSGAELVAVADPSSEGRAYAEKSDVACYESFDELVGHSELDAVAVCSPTDQHANHVVAAARAGKHLFCEKPLDLSVARVEETLAVVNEAGVKLMLGFNRRFDRHFAKLKSLVASGSVGEPHIIKLTSRDPAPPPLEFIKHSGGLFLDMTIHDFDMARHLAGCDAVEVYAKGANLLDPAIGEAGDVDTAVCVITFENGATAVIDNSRKAVYGYDQRAEVFGTKGMASIGNETPDRHELFTAAGQQGPLLEDFFLERYALAYRAEMQAFVNAVKDRKPVPVGGEDGLKALKLGVAALQSAKEHRPVAVA